LLAPFFAKQITHFKFGAYEVSNIRNTPLLQRQVLLQQNHHTRDAWASSEQQAKLATSRNKVLAAKRQGPCCNGRFCFSLPASQAES